MSNQFDKIKINCFTILIIQGIQAFFYELYTSAPRYVDNNVEECRHLLEWSFATLIALATSIVFCSLNIIAAYFRKPTLLKYISMMVGFAQLAILVTYCGDWIYLNSHCGSLNHLNKIFFIIMVTIICISCIVRVVKFVNSHAR